MELNQKVKNPAFDLPVVNVSAVGNKLTVTYLMDEPVSDVGTIDPTRGSSTIVVRVGVTPVMILGRALPLNRRTLLYLLGVAEK